MNDLGVGEIVETVVRERFSNDSIRSVQVTHDVDDEGDAILRIVIVMNGQMTAIDKKKILGLVRHIRSELDSAEKIGFPIVDFVTMADAAKMRREIA